MAGAARRSNRGDARMTMHIDVCNGDADGLCALVQWRLHAPRVAQLITGLKRDIELVQHVQAAQGDQLLVCDLSLRRNRQPLLRLLAAGVFVRYFDHHTPGDIPVHPLLEAHIDTASNTCTSLLVDAYLGGQFRAWALVGAFGDSLISVAEGLALDMGLSAADRQRLQSLGKSINYNAYGDDAQDVYILPAQLFPLLLRYHDPLDFLDHECIGAELNARRHADLQQAHAMRPIQQSAHARIYLLPAAPWSRRVLGSLGNALAVAEPQCAHALLRTTATGSFVVSVRAPLCAPVGAAEFCRPFGGDGRAAAAGIDNLPTSQLGPFMAAFAATPWQNAARETTPPRKGDA